MSQDIKDLKQLLQAAANSNKTAPTTNKKK